MMESGVYVNEDGTPVMENGKKPLCERSILFNS